MVVPVIRRPSVAGYFYPADRAALAAAIRQALPAKTETIAATAVLVPHGGWAQTSAVMAETLGRIEIPKRCLLLGASHTGTRAHWSVMSAGAYETPLGEVSIDEQAVDALRRACPQLQVDDEAHVGEHSLEVVLPWLQTLGRAELQVVPVVAGSLDAASLGVMADGIAGVLRHSTGSTLIIMSSDLSHYLAQERARAEDESLLACIARLDGAGLLSQVDARQLVMCGDGAVACGLEVAARLGAGRAVQVAYRTSAETGGDPQAVIGYAGVIIHH
ncbi:MAG: AmmeMemoRadiSam system protein B [Candidatus Omnitrophica bacterium CG11_big_fil_rev_8_21_14_0_20_63_9]|nr:MAG: AmmeMemoRadiSam system protein B [Candidatus Omnitrophica bacterium CG11_big_fil_rev_8_21_14_0_20_63_9]